MLILTIVDISYKRLARKDLFSIAVNKNKVLFLPSTVSLSKKVNVICSMFSVTGISLIALAVC